MVLPAWRTFPSLLERVPPALQAEALGNDAGALAEVHESGDGVDFHLLHDVAPVNLDGLLGNAERVRYLLVEAAGDDVLHHFSFPVGESGDSLADPLQFACVGLGSAVAFHRTLNGLKQDFVIDGLEKEIHRALFYGVHAGGDIAMAGKEDNREHAVAGSEPVT